MRFFCKYIYCFLVSVIFVPGAFAQSPTIIKGTVTDAKTKEPISFANVIFIDGGAAAVGASTDLDGNYKIETTTPTATLEFSFIGYESVREKVAVGKTQTINVRLQPDARHLKTLVFTDKRGKYSKKNNPAVEMMRKAIANKDKNRLENFDYYKYQQHEKMLLALANVADSAEASGMFKQVKFLYEASDTSRLTGERYLPFYLGETLSDRYYRKNPEAAKVYVDAKRNIEISKFLDTESLDAITRQIFGEINIYDNDVFLLGNRFMSPFSPGAINFYRFYITDTLMLSGVPCYSLYFTPANPLDFGFKGNLYLTADSSYAVKKAELYITSNSQVNFVTALLVEQEFEQRDSMWVLNKDVMTAEFSLLARSYLSFYGSRENTYKNLIVDVPIPDSVFNGLAKTIRTENYDQRDEAYWAANRLDTLTDKEAKVYTSIQRLEQVGVFRFVKNTVMGLVGGYFEAGPIDIGPWENMLSFNSIENVRLRVGGKTNGRFSKHLFFEWFLAYGTRDEQFKYNTTAMYSFNRKKNHPWEFPKNLLTVTYEYDTKIPGQGHKYGTGDRLLLSIGRGHTEKMTFERRLEVNYEKEFNDNNFSYALNFKHLEQEPLGQLSFATYNGNNYDAYVTTSFALNLRYAPNERFFQTQKSRYPINEEAPVYQLKYTAGAAGLWGGDYTFHTLQATFDKRWFITGYGYLDVSAGAGKIFNTVPYPSLFVIQANQDLAFQEEAFNMMRFFEFVADQYVDLKLSYCFNGYLFNRIPLIRELKWRELITFKAVYGGVSKRNIPDADNDLMLFPSDANGNLTTFALGDEPFMEAGIGIDHIFSFLRVDFVRRLNYLDHPSAKKWSVRLQFRFSF